MVQRVIYSAIAYFFIRIVIFVLKDVIFLSFAGLPIGSFFLSDNELISIIAVVIGFATCLCGYQGSKTSNKNCLLIYLIVNCCCCCVTSVLFIPLYGVTVFLDPPEPSCDPCECWEYETGDALAVGTETSLNQDSRVLMFSCRI